jgi:hypothetical protein
MTVSDLEARLARVEKLLMEQALEIERLRDQLGKQSQQVLAIPGGANQ